MSTKRISIKKRCREKRPIPERNSEDGPETDVYMCKCIIARGEKMDKKQKDFMGRDRKAMYEEKRRYVERILAPALLPLEADVFALTYQNEGYTEVVTVYYYGGHTDRINVTANSLLAIAHEVIREIDGHRAHGHIYERGENHDSRAEA